MWMLIIKRLTITARPREQDQVADTGTYKRTGSASDNFHQECHEILRGLGEHCQCRRKLECNVSQIRPILCDHRLTLPSSYQFNPERHPRYPDFYTIEMSGFASGKGASLRFRLLPNIDPALHYIANRAVFPLPADHRRSRPDPLVRTFCRSATPFGPGSRLDTESRRARCPDECYHDERC
jgi:hypothetical protein